MIKHQSHLSKLDPTLKSGLIARLNDEWEHLNWECEQHQEAVKQTLNRMNELASVMKRLLADE